jgi:uncharacterized membrane-anchored protein YitT (DUF2179 family)
MDKKRRNIWEPHGVVMEYLLMTAATIILVIGVYFFKFPNKFSFGGVTGFAVVLERLFRPSASTFTFCLNMALLAVGFLFVGKSFGVKTVYVSVLMSVLLSLLDRFVPLQAPLTGQPMLELVFAIVLPAFSAAILFNMNASSGGTDIVAMILRKYTSVNIGTALLLADCMIVLASCFVFDVQTGLFSFCGLLAKSLVVDGVIENMNLCKYFTIVCEDPEPICEFIENELDRGATIFRAEGAYSHREKSVILTVMRRGQAVRLRNFVKQRESSAFIMITNSSEIIGQGFRGSI